MKEMITRAQADTLIWVVAALGIVAVPIAVAVARRRKANVAPYATLAGAPILCALLWPIYNAIEDKFGLDSVAALAINFGLFVAVGAAVGVGWARLFSRNVTPKAE